jgi:hypothetical protein
MSWGHCHKLQTTFLHAVAFTDVTHLDHNIKAPDAPVPLKVKADLCL